VNKEWDLPSSAVLAGLLFRRTTSYSWYLNKKSLSFSISTNTFECRVESSRVVILQPSRWLKCFKNSIIQSLIQLEWNGSIATIRRMENMRPTFQLLYCELLAYFIVSHWSEKFLCRNLWLIINVKEQTFKDELGPFVLLAPPELLLFTKRRQQKTDFHLISHPNPYLIRQVSFRFHGSVSRTHLYGDLRRLESWSF
jgi:hypothetical protein